ncbi:MAG TPA: hypothetical protein VK393_08180 [Nocardioidaceae bacterium]|jgi:hypothetical protein|nr:hypothetical protein [Nocardioidaceae bacterium]
MTIILVVLALTAGLALLGIGLLREIRRDGYGYRPPPRSHVDEPETPGRLAPLGC